MRRSFEQRFLGVCRSGSASVSDTETDARRPSPVTCKSIASVFIPLRDTFTNRYDGRTHRRAHMRHGLLLGKRGFRNPGVAPLSGARGEEKDAHIITAVELFWAGFWRRLLEPAQPVHTQTLTVACVLARRTRLNPRLCAHVLIELPILTV